MKLSQLLEKFGPNDWGDFPTSITTRVSQARSSTYDKFNLNNSVDLVLRILKTDVIWITFEKEIIPVSKKVTQNAFQVLFDAQNRTTLPAKLNNPFTQKLSLFNDTLDAFNEMGAKFSVSECAPRARNMKTGEATELVYDVSNWRRSL